MSKPQTLIDPSNFGDPWGSKVAPWVPKVAPGVPKVTPQGPPASKNNWVPKATPAALVPFIFLYFSPPWFAILLPAAPSPPRPTNPSTLRPNNP